MTWSHFIFLVPLQRCDFAVRRWLNRKHCLFEVASCLLCGWIISYFSTGKCDSWGKQSVSTSGSKWGIHLIDGMSGRGWLVSSCVLFVMVPLIPHVKWGRSPGLFLLLQEIWCFGICNEKFPRTEYCHQEELQVFISGLSLVNGFVWGDCN